MSLAKNIESRSLFDNIAYDRRSMPSLYKDKFYKKPMVPRLFNKQTQFTADVKPIDGGEGFPHIVHDNFKERDSNATLHPNYSSSNLDGTKYDENNTADLKDKEILSSKPAITITDYGEPQRSQYIRVNFNPISGIDDNEHVLNKCIEFWKFIDKHTELHNLKVIADRSDIDVADTDTKVSESHVYASHISALTVLASRSSASQTTAVSTSSSEEMGLTPLAVLALNWLKHESVMTDSLATKQERDFFDPVQNEYIDNCVKEEIDDVAVKEKMDSRQVTESKSHTSVSTTSMGQKRKRTKLILKPVEDLSKMMAEMNKWDSEHPKSLNAPGIAPKLIHAEFINPKNILQFIGRNDEKSC